MWGGIEQTLRSRHAIELPEGTGSAAVAIILRKPKAPEVLLIRRAAHPSDPWSGHMAFPGGRRDPEDLSLEAAARRETLEEVGLTLHDEERLGRLDDLEAIGRGVRKGLVIRPFIFRLERPVEFTTNYEVDEVIWAPLFPMHGGELDSHHMWTGGPAPVRFPAFDVKGRIVWGLTYRMLRQLLGFMSPSGGAANDSAGEVIARENKEIP